MGRTLPTNDLHEVFDATGKTNIDKTDGQLFITEFHEFESK